MGARSGGGGAASGFGSGSRGGSVQSIAKATQKAFFSQGNSDYFNGSNSPAAIKANQDYETKMSQFKDAWTKAGGSKPAFGDWSGLMLDVANGNIGIG